MADPREAIMARLLELMKLVVTPDNVFRNKIEVAEARRPAIVCLDSDETRDQTLDASGRNRPPTAPVIMVFNPEVFILVQEKEENVGTALNSWRAQIVKAVMKDATLKSLCHEIRYDGFITALAAGRTMEGQGRVHFSFLYHFRIDQL
jgi:hypothetical protein